MSLDMWGLTWFPDQGSNHIPYIARWILNYWATSEVPSCLKKKKNQVYDGLCESKDWICMKVAGLSSPLTAVLFLPNWRQGMLTPFSGGDSEASVTLAGLPPCAGAFHLLGLPWWLRWSRTQLQCQRPRFPFLGREDFPGGGNGNPFPYSCLGNPIDRGVWRATVHGVAKSWTQLSDFPPHLLVL